MPPPSKELKFVILFGVLIQKTASESDRSPVGGAISVLVSAKWIGVSRAAWKRVRLSPPQRKNPDEAARKRGKIE